MMRVLICGANGRMGRVLSEHISRHKSCETVAGIDPAAQENRGFPVFTSFEACTVTADVIVDFSGPSALNALLEYALSRNMPLVIATTGFSPEQTDAIKKASEMIPVFFTANMSLGVNLMLSLAKTAAKVLGDGFDVEIIEKHHNQKVDAPSGTALMLAEAVSSVLSYESRHSYGRGPQSGRRDKSEIGIHAVRGGTITGEHDVIFAGPDETLVISHRAASREVFAAGAVNAALFLYGKAPGMYSMADLVGGM